MRRARIKRVSLREPVMLGEVCELVHWVVMWNLVTGWELAAIRAAENQAAIEWPELVEPG
jgi:hypothetical protein